MLRLQSPLNAQNVQNTTKFIKSDIKGFFGSENITKLCDEIIGLYAADRLPCSINITDSIWKSYYCLKMNRFTTICAKIMHVKPTLSPHNCRPELAVSSLSHCIKN